ncbi:GGDEF domain-containing protein [Paucibacter sp. APW11]|uniref:diguanylate cyclase n=1 Tax=Roseateles aquae TaxID=3077235 RepID=A0ABU3PH96_9BURK|nr:GGDEF domain-containing protein [Paucibacter sp. APW11]MDT9001477.1 GGDEF domain-containing protein [Paucibacter sp. APW11]
MSEAGKRLLLICALAAGLLGNATAAASSRPDATDSPDALLQLMQSSYTQAARAVAREQSLADSAERRIAAARQELRLLQQYGRFADLQALLKRQQADAELSQDAALRIDQQITAARIALSEGQAAQAARALASLRERLVQINEPEQRDRAVLALAAVDAALGQRDAATQALGELIKRALRGEAGGEQQNRAALAYMQLAAIQLDMRDYQQGLLYYQEALRTAPDWAQHTQARARMGVAQMLNMTGGRPQAFEQLSAALAQFRLSDDQHGEADALLLQGFFLSRDGQARAAIAPYRQALALREGLHAQADVINALTHLGAQLAQVGQLAEAVLTTRRAVDLAQATDSASLQSDALNTYAEALAANGQPAQAFQEMSRAYSALQKMARLELVSQTGALREQFETDRQKLENERLNERLQLQQSGQSRLRWAFGVLAGLTALLLAALIALGRLYLTTRRLAQHDGLTGLYNRRRVLQLLEAEIERARRYQLQLALLSVDLDNFKKINDSQGHACGDRVLKDVARLFRQTLRQEDLAGRVGGEEFLLLLPHTGEAAALQLAERLRAQMEAELSVVPGWPVTASIGVASWMPGLGADELLQRADTALYEAKHKGRNRSELASQLGGLDSVPGGALPA